MWSLLLQSQPSERGRYKAKKGRGDVDVHSLDGGTVTAHNGLAFIALEAQYPDKSSCLFKHNIIKIRTDSMCFLEENDSSQSPGELCAKFSTQDNKLSLIVRLGYSVLVRDPSTATAISDIILPFNDSAIACLMRAPCLRTFCWIEWPKRLDSFFPDQTDRQAFGQCLAKGGVAQNRRS
jgi:hypothetical protein